MTIALAVSVLSFVLAGELALVRFFLRIRKRGDTFALIAMTTCAVVSAVWHVASSQLPIWANSLFPLTTGALYLASWWATGRPGTRSSTD